MPWWSARQPSFFEAEEILNLSPSRDIHVEPSVKKTCTVENMVLQNRSVRLQLITDSVGTSTGFIMIILRKNLLLTKVCTCWIPQMLDQNMKDCRRHMSCENLVLMQLDWKLFLKCIVTGNETWIHHYVPESKQQSMQWKHASSPSPQKFRLQPSTGKIMCTIFWNAEGVLLIDCKPHKVTVTGLFTLTYFTNCMLHLKRNAEESWPM